jgi:GMP synthase (glutamine-hydrolysing)
MPKPLRFLIVDGYSEKSRNDLETAGMKLAWVLYKEMLHQHMPETEYEILLPTDPGVKRPTGTDLEVYDAIIWTGCNLTIYDKENPSVATQLDLAREGYEIGIPSFGSCWGIQMAAYAAGGDVQLHPKGREMGIARKIRLTPEGLKHPMYDGKPPVFDAFISHDDQVTELPEGGTLLASNNYTRVQAISVTHKKGTFWGVQYHPEYDLHEMARLIVAREYKLVPQGLFTGHEDLMAMVTRMEELFADQGRLDHRWQLGIDEDVLCDSIRQCEFVNWLRHLVVPTADKRRKEA